MARLLFFTLFIVSPHVFAAQCLELEMTGLTNIQNKKTVFTVAPKTSSEISYSIHIDERGKISPYLDRTAKGVFIVKEREIIKIKSIEYAVANPLAETHEVSKKIASYKCE